MHLNIVVMLGANRDILEEQSEANYRADEFRVALVAFITLL